MARCFPSLFGMAIEKDVSAADYLRVIGGQVFWNIQSLFG